MLDNWKKISFPKNHSFWNEWMNEWMNEGMNEWLIEWMNEWIYKIVFTFLSFDKLRATMS